jgi:hypothetical protein
VYQSLSFDPDLAWSPQHRRPKRPFSFHTRFGCKKDHIAEEKNPTWSVLFLVNAQQIQTRFNKNVLARTIKEQKQRFHRLLHILWKTNGTIAPWHSPSILRRQMRRARMRKTNNKNALEMASGRYVSVKTCVHDLLKYVDDTGDRRKAQNRIDRIIDPFGIAEVIGCFVVQVWMARFLVKKKKGN